MPDHPRAKAIAYTMMVQSEESLSGMAADKEWDKSWESYIALKAKREAEHKKKIVQRQREVAAAADARVKEEEEKNEREREQLLARLVSEENARNEMMFRSSAAAAETFRQHEAQAYEDQRRLKEKRAQKAADEENRRRLASKVRPAACRAVRAACVGAVRRKRWGLGGGRGWARDEC